MATFGNYELLCHSEVKGPLHQSRCYRADALAIATNADFTASGRVGQAAITALRLASNSSNPKPDPKGSSRFSVSVVLTWLTETGERFSKPMRQKRQASWQPPTCIFLKHRSEGLHLSRATWGTFQPPYSKRQPKSTKTRVFTICRGAMSALWRTSHATRVWHQIPMESCRGSRT